MKRTEPAPEFDVVLDHDLDQNLDFDGDVDV